MNVDESAMEPADGFAPERVMTQESAECEAGRRWCCSARSGRCPIADRRGERYRVGYTDGEFIYILGHSDLGWREAFAMADAWGGKRED